jgi:hypothetical protein
MMVGASYQSFLLIMAQGPDFPQSTVRIKFVMEKARNYWEKPLRAANLSSMYS